MDFKLFESVFPGWKTYEMKNLEKINHKTLSKTFKLVFRIYEEERPKVLKNSLPNNCLSLLFFITG